MIEANYFATHSACVKKGYIRCDLKRSKPEASQNCTYFEEEQESLLQAMVGKAGHWLTAYKSVTI